jgi:hypothetical protein
MESSNLTALHPWDIREWTRKVIRVWKPESITSISLRANGGVLFVAELTTGLRLHLGISQCGVDICALWRGEECVLWDALIGFCPTWSAASTSGEIPDRSFDLDAAMRPLIRRNCYLLGVNIQATPGEQRQWKHWLEQQGTAYPVATSSRYRAE